MPTPPAALVKSIIGSKHPDYEENLDKWKRNEVLFAADDEVYDYLKAFTWEAAATDEYQARKDDAVFVEFPSLMMEKFTGALDSSAPMPDFGTLGEVRTERTGEPTQAELVFDNADGVGLDARSWRQFWKDILSLSPATEYRWVFVEASPEAPATRADEIRGARPYLVEFSPISVPNWGYSRGTLDWCRIELERRNLRVEDGKLVDEVTPMHYILVREGFTGLGDDFAAGGWWMFDGDGMPVIENDAELAGDWTATVGEIPMTRLYYEKRSGKRRKSGLSNIGRLSVRFMNLLAALFNDAWTSGQRQVFITGVSASQWREVVDAGKGGGKWVPVPAEPGTNPGIHDAGSVTASGAIVTAMEKTLDLIEKYVMRELTTSPDASGRAKEVEIVAGNSPRLAHMAGNLEEAQRAAIRFLEMRFGNASPTGSVTWPREFDLRSTATKIRETIAAMRDAGASSPTLISDLVMQSVRAAGIPLSAPDGDEQSAEETVRTEIADSLSRQAQAGALGSEFGLNF